MGKQNGTIEIRVVASEGWEYGGEMHPIGKRFTLDKSDEAKLQRYLDEEIIEIIVPTRIVDEKERTEIIAQTVNMAMDQYIKAHPAQGSHIRVHDRYVDDDKYHDTGDYGSFSEFCGDLYKQKTGRTTEKLMKWSSMKSVQLRVGKAATSMGEVIDSEGGVLVPTEYSARLLQETLEASIIRPRATFVPMATNSVKIPAVDETSHASNVFGGVVASWVDEGTDPGDTKPKLGSITLTLNKLLANAKVTSELLEDSVISLEALLPAMFSQAIAFQEDDAFINGTGAGQPQGLRNSAAAIDQAKETGQAATTIVAKNILKMWSRCRGKSSAVWLANHDAFPELASLALEVGTGGGPVGLLQSQNVQGSPVQTMMGRPVIFTELCQTLGTSGDIILFDPRTYLIGGKSASAAGPGAMASSIHLLFDADEVAFKIRSRVDGQCWVKSALTPRYGSTTISPIITLATRS